MVNVMKLISSYSVGNYSRNYINFSRKLLIYSLIIFIIVFLIIIFKLSFNCRFYYLIEQKENNFYQVIVSYQDLSIWINQKNFYYDKKLYSYSIKEVGKESFFQNNKVYLQLLIEVDQLSNSIPFLEISLDNENITLFDYLNKKIRGK